MDKRTTEKFMHHAYQRMHKHMDHGNIEAVTQISACLVSLYTLAEHENKHENKHEIKGQETPDYSVGYRASL